MVRVEGHLNLVLVSAKMDGIKGYYLHGLIFGRCFDALAREQERGAPRLLNCSGIAGVTLNRCPSLKLAKTSNLLPLPCRMSSVLTPHPDRWQMPFFSVFDLISVPEGLQADNVLR